MNNLDMGSPIYLFTGTEIGERTSAVTKIKNELTKQYGTLDFHNLYADSSSIQQVLSLLQTGNLFMSALCVVLNNAEEVKKADDIEALIKWASEKPAFPSFLILTSDAYSINKKIENIVPKNQKQIFWEMFENKKQEWIRSFFAKEKIKITDNAIEDILQLVENNTQALKTSCSHLSLFFDEGAVIEDKNIENILSHTKEENPFTLFDSILRLNLQKSITISQKLMQTKNTSCIQIISALTYSFRRLLDWHNSIKEFGGFDEFNMKKKGFTSKTMITQYKTAEKNFSIEETRNILALLTSFDYEMRGLPVPLHNVLLDQLIYCIIKKRLKLNAKYQNFPYKIF